MACESWPYPIDGGFTEGFATADLPEAQALREALS
jgi:hypothetical protein